MAERNAGVRDIVPVNLRHLVRQEREAQELSWGVLAKKPGAAVDEFSRRESYMHRNGFQRSTIARFADALNSTTLHKLAHSDLYWDEITTIEPAGDAMTYDLTVEGHHNFVANDLIVHNSHAADYAVIAVQTAFLKTHYGPEYMAALLSTYFDDVDKVTTFLGECKRLNIPILPPDINASALDFDIELLPDGRRGIRFGLAAIKNAGVGALEVILNEREAGGRFTDVSDFARRLDLRTVGRRALEALIMVGALSSLDPDRPRLLNGLDRVISHSTALHKATEVGQSSLFGESETPAGDLLGTLPPAAAVPHRQILNWEKELVGIYISSHPIDPVLDVVRGLNIVSTADLHDPESGLAERGVRFVGLVTSLRKMPTKNKDMMAVAQLEDKLGIIEAVMFPRTWAKMQEQVQEGAVLLFSGKLDVSRGEPQIIVESVTQQFEAFVADVAPQENAPPPVWAEESASAEPSLAPAWSPPLPPPEPPPAPAWDELAMTSSSEPPAFSDLPPEWALDSPVAPPPPAVHPITITFLRNGDAAKDERRLRRLLGKISEFPGQDPFLVVLVNPDGERYEMRFPQTTQCCDALLTALAEIVGAECIAVE